MDIKHISNSNCHITTWLCCGSQIQIVHSLCELSLSETIFMPSKHNIYFFMILIITDSDSKMKFRRFLKKYCTNLVTVKDQHFK